MDTQEARSYIRDLAEEALELIEGWESSAVPPAKDKLRLRELASDARTALPDAGFPAEGAWRGLQRASIGTQTSLDQTDKLYWEDVAAELHAGVDTLDLLVSPGASRESDFRIVG